jgi:eukaryotic-like serine/threonine-protein kinase
LNSCLAKDTDERWQSPLDLKWELERIKNGPQASSTAPSQWRFSKWPWVRGGWNVHTGFCRPKAPRQGGDALRDPRARRSNLRLCHPHVSPDGGKIAFVATGADRKTMLRVRPLDAEEARPLAGTEDANGIPVIWSPDSRYLAFASGAKLKKIEATGGPRKRCATSRLPARESGFRTIEFFLPVWEP